MINYKRNKLLTQQIFVQVCQQVGYLCTSNITTPYVERKLQQTMLRTDIICKIIPGGYNMHKYVS